MEIFHGYIILSLIDIYSRIEITLDEKFININIYIKFITSKHT